MIVVAAVIGAALWFFWPQVLKAREPKQPQLDDMLKENGQLTTKEQEAIDAAKLIADAAKKVIPPKPAPRSEPRDSTAT